MDKSVKMCLRIQQKPRRSENIYRERREKSAENPTDHVCVCATGPAGTRFSKAPETFRARKAILSSSVSKSIEVNTPETSYMKRTSVHIKNKWIRQLCNHKLGDFVMAFRVRELFGTFEKRAPGPRKALLSLSSIVHQHRQLHASVLWSEYRRMVLNKPCPH